MANQNGVRRSGRKVIIEPRHSDRRDAGNTPTALTRSLDLTERASYPPFYDREPPRGRTSPTCRKQLPMTHTRPLTNRGYRLGDVVSALQKTIRRGDERLAGYFAMELFESNFEAYAWRRLLTISAEDCHGCITQEIKALYDSAALVKKTRKTPERIFLAKAAVVLAAAKKCRDADHMSCLMYDKGLPDDATVQAALDEARAEYVALPGYTYDCHTTEGRRAGKTRRDFFLDEYDALTFRERGLFDDDLENLRTTTTNERRTR